MSSSKQDLPKQKCMKCKRSISCSEFLICCNCEQVFDLDCTVVTARRFRLMLKEDREKWICNPCLNKKKKKVLHSKPTCSGSNTPKLTTIMKSPTNATKTKNMLHTDKITEKSRITSISSSFENITTRQKGKHNKQPLNISSAASEENDNSFLSIDSTFRRSLPDLSIINKDELIDLKQKIEELSLQLESAHMEIENLILEKGSLENKIALQDRKIDHLLQICSNVPAEVSTTKKKKKKGKKINKSQVHTSLDLDNNSCGELNGLNDSVNLNNDTNANSMHEHNPQNAEGYFNSKKKLCVMSTIGGHRLIPIIDALFYSNFDYCHNVTLGGGIKQLFYNFETKLKNYTMNDFCIVFIGESDFNCSRGIDELINCIRKESQKVHTNVIIALPTYICGRVLYNSRVELFNNRLNMDIQHNNHYAFLIDSNDKLSLDMFSRLTGKINRGGLRNIFKNVDHLMTLITNESKGDSSDSAPINKDNNKTNNFFLL